MDYGLGSSYLLLKSTEKETFLRDWRVEKGVVSCVVWGSGIRAHYWKWSFIIDISACVIVDGLINPIVLAWMIGC